LATVEALALDNTAPDQRAHLDLHQRERIGGPDVASNVWLGVARRTRSRAGRSRCRSYRWVAVLYHPCLLMTLPAAGRKCRVDEASIPEGCCGGGSGRLR